MPLGSNPVPLHERLKKRLDELDFKPYKDKNNPLGNPDNSPNCTVGIIVSGDHDVLTRLAFGAQDVDFTLKRSNANVCLCHDIKAWAMDTYQWACRRWGAENIIAFDVHNDETTPHIHIQTVPVAKTKTRGRASVKYIHKDDKTKVLSQKEWKKLFEDARRDYVRTEMERREKECVAKAKTENEQLHHQKSQLEGEVQQTQQKKAELDGKVSQLMDYADKLDIKNEDLNVPRLKTSKIVTDAINAINEELGIAIPAFKQKEWREQRKLAIKTILTNMQNEIFNAQELKEKEILELGRSIYKSAMKKTAELIKQNQQLHKENERVKAENGRIKAENDSLKVKISTMDENAVKRVAAQKDEVIGKQKEQLESARKELTKQSNDYNALLSKYEYLVVQWNELTQQPEIIEAMERIEERKKEEAEARREEEARCYRHQGAIDRFIDEGRDALGSFSRTTRTDFNEKEVNAIYYGIMATASKHGLPLDSSKGIEDAVGKFLEVMNWSGCSDFRTECVTSWTNLFAAKEVTFSESVICHFLAFVDHMSCSADTYASLGGSNGCADQLTNWDGTQKTGLGTPAKKKEGLSR